MPNLDQKKQDPENNPGNDPAQQTQEETGPEGTEGQEAKEPEGTGTSQEGDLTDKHGQPGINREKYQRDIQARDDRIAELEKQVAEAAKTEEGRKEMQEKIDELKQTISDDRINFELERAGCLNPKAARAILDDYEGNIDELKKACPYLFQDGTKKTGSTGIKPEGSPSNKIDEMLDHVFGK